ncbi:MAG: adenine deaminase [Verrucomicrobiota bacterium]|nr:adenine deaminase [Verrucomicrobiota bacterium]
MNKVKSISGMIVDIIKKEIYAGTLYIKNGIIDKITREDGDNSKKKSNYIIPGFVDSHIHVESSMLVPSEFAVLAVPHGTVGVIADPHEIANVLGVDGVEYMIEDGEKVPLKFYFGAPSCVPATPFETSGASVSVDDIQKLLKRDEIHFLSEMMNFPGVINEDPVVMEKIKSALDSGKVVDGHSPGIMGDELKKYAGAGISTDHECFSIEEAEQKIKNNVFVQIREGSAARNFDDLVELLRTYPDKCMFCSDDKHPDDLLKGHINLLVKKALKKEMDLFNVLRAASLNPIKHYKMDVGLLQEGDSADFLEVDNLTDLNIKKTVINGMIVAESGKTAFKTVDTRCINIFNCKKKKVSDFAIKLSGNAKIDIIKAFDGQLITDRLIEKATIVEGYAISDIKRDILKIANINRYKNTLPALAFINGFGLKSGAIASSVGHDSHNILAVGTNDEDLCRAVNLIIESKGGVCVVQGKTEKLLPLPVAGIMTNADGKQTAEKYSFIDDFAKELGTSLRAPFMTLSFMALLVIPKIKLSDKGLFDGESFRIMKDG